MTEKTPPGKIGPVAGLMDRITRLATRQPASEEDIRAELRHESRSHDQQARVERLSNPANADHTIEDMIARLAADEPIELEDIYGHSSQKPDKWAQVDQQLRTFVGALEKRIVELVMRLETHQNNAAQLKLHLQLMDTVLQVIGEKLGTDKKGNTVEWQNFKRAQTLIQYASELATRNLEDYIATEQEAKPTYIEASYGSEAARRMAHSIQLEQGARDSFMGYDLSQNRKRLRRLVMTVLRQFQTLIPENLADETDLANAVEYQESFSQVCQDELTYLAKIVTNEALRGEFFEVKERFKTTRDYLLTHGEDEVLAEVVEAWLALPQNRGKLSLPANDLSKLVELIAEEVEIGSPEEAWRTAAGLLAVVVTDKVNYSAHTDDLIEVAEWAVSQFQTQPIPKTPTIEAFQEQASAALGVILPKVEQQLAELQSAKYPETVLLAISSKKKLITRLQSLLSLANA